MDESRGVARGAFPFSGKFDVFFHQIQTKRVQEKIIPMRTPFSNRGSASNSLLTTSCIQEIMSVDNRALLEGWPFIRAYKVRLATNLGKCVFIWIISLVYA